MHTMDIFKLREQILLIFLAFISSSCLLEGNSKVMAQDTLRVELRAISMGDSIRLRWVPGSAEAWRLGNQNGYAVYRYVLQQDTHTLTNQEFVDSKDTLELAMTPEAEAFWDTLSTTKDAAGVVGAALYADEFRVTNVDSTSIVDIYKGAQEEENRYGMGVFAANNSFEVAKASALGFTDINVVSGNKYFYVVEINNVPGGKLLWPGMQEIHVDSVLALNVVDDLSASVVEKQVGLRWSTYNTKEDYYGYYVERSSDNVNFTRLNTEPYVELENPYDPYVLKLQDSLPNDVDSFYYRIIGHSPFDIEGPASQSLAVKAVQPSKVVNTNVNNVEELPDGSIKLNWNIYLGQSNDIVEYDVYRSVHPDSGYVKMNASPLASNVTEYIDSNPLQVGYYKVVTKDVNGYYHESTFIMAQKDDSTPPQIPTGLDADVDKSGRIVIKWSPCPDSDVLGYRVFYSNHPDAQFAELTTSVIKDTATVHYLNLNTLTKKIYYRVSAQDFRHNESDWSEPLEVDRPDIIPPVSPSLLEAIPSTKGVILKFRYSHSDDVDIHQIQRKPSNSYSWNNISVIYGAQSSGHIVAHIDSFTNFKETYHYRILAIDDSGNKSSSRLVTVKPLVPQVRGAFSGLGYNIIDISGTVSPTFYFQNIDILHFKNLMIYWDYDLKSDVLEYQIYRSVGGTALKSYTVVNDDYFTNTPIPPGVTIPPSGLFFIDDDLVMKATALNSSNAYGTTNGSTGSSGGGSSGGGSGGASGSAPGSSGSNNDVESDIYIYQIQARHKDGSMSPMSPQIVIQL